MAAAEQAPQSTPEQLVHVCVAVVTEAEATERTHAGQREARDHEREAARIALVNAEHSFDREPTPATGDALERERRRSTEADLLARRAVERHEAATRSLHVAREALARARNEVRLADLRQRSSADTFHARASSPALRFLAALDELRAAAAEIDQAFADANGAAREHGATGGGALPDLDVGHVLLDALDVLAARGIVIDPHAWTTGLRYALMRSGTSLTNRAIGPRPVALLGILLDLLEKGPSGPDHAIEATRRRLALCRETRTYAEAMTREAERDRAADERRRASAGPKATPAPPSGMRVVTRWHLGNRNPDEAPEEARPAYEANLVAEKNSKAETLRKAEEERTAEPTRVQLENMIEDAVDDELERLEDDAAFKRRRESGG
jgi:hypothetical protein